MSGDINGVPVVGVTVTVPPLKWHVELNDAPQDAGDKVMVRVMVAVTCSRFPRFLGLRDSLEWRGFRTRRA